AYGGMAARKAPRKAAREEANGRRISSSRAGMQQHGGSARRTRRNPDSARQRIQGRPHDQQQRVRVAMAATDMDSRWQQVRDGAVQPAAASQPQRRMMLKDSSAHNLRGSRQRCRSGRAIA
ncbi:hypothetical protein Dimus_024411, partial [Dionaea muscipula]